MTGKSMLWIVMVCYTSGLLYAVWRLAMALSYKRWPKFLFIVPGFLIQTAFLWQLGLKEGRCPVANMFEALTFTAWCLTGLHLCILSFRSVQYFTVFYMPMVLAIQLGAMLTPERGYTQDRIKESILGLHASVIILGYAALGLASAFAAMYLVQEYQLRRHRITTSFMLLPPLNRIEWMQKWMIWSGFSLLTLGLGAGIMAFQGMQLSFSEMDPKLIWSLMVWGLYFILGVSHFLGAVKGRWLAWGCLCSGVFVLTTFWISNLLSQFHRY